MKVLVLGSGGREHALAHSISKSPLCERVFIAPGNGGTGQVGENVAVNPENFEAVKLFVINNKIDFVVVGPEAPLVAGISDFFSNDNELKHIPVFGPKKLGAMLEGSKAFAKTFMQKHGIPTAKYAEFNGEQLEEAHAYLKEQGAPIVIKADGLAAGKGVRVCFTNEEATEALNDILADKMYGEAGASVVIEEFLEGIELSVFAITDGNTYTLLPNAKDYKRVGEGDTGLNTGGMGAISPVPFASEEFMAHVTKTVVEPTIKGLKADGIDYKGFLYFGLMKVGDEAFVIEYNARMGDPETEAVLPRVKSDLFPVLLSAAKGELGDVELEFISESAATVIMVSRGYPGNYEKGKSIRLPKESNSIIYHAGTKMNGDLLQTSGGRVLAITSLKPSLQEALDTSYETVNNISFEGSFQRNDIGFDVEK